MKNTGSVAGDSLWRMNNAGGDSPRSAPNETKNGQAVNGARTDL
jgi:hypothetical protein